MGICSLMIDRHHCCYVFTDGRFSLFSMYERLHLTPALIFHPGRVGQCVWVRHDLYQRPGPQGASGGRGGVSASL